MPGKNVIEIPPDPAFLLQGMRCIGYTLETALADIIDNSITAGSSNINVKFAWNDGYPWIAIVDDGCGMDEHELIEAMRFGGRQAPSDERDREDLGRFGLGLKTASLSQCRKMTVITKKNSQVKVCSWDLDLLTSSKTRTWDAVLPTIADIENDPIASVLLRPLEKADCGTVVLWEKLDLVTHEGQTKTSQDDFSEKMARASKHIALFFHRFFRKEGTWKAINFYFNGRHLEAINPFGKSHPARQELREEIIPIDGEKVVIQPFILPHHSKISKQDYESLAGEEGYLQNQGFYVYRNRRLIIRGNWFRLIPKSELTKLVRIQVDIPNTLDHLWKLDIKKSRAIPPLAVMNRLKMLLPAITDHGKRPYKSRGNRTLSIRVPIWCREYKNGHVSYLINEDHPLVKSLLGDSGSEDYQRKCSILRIISGNFPTETFHVDANDDAHITIAPAAEAPETESIVREMVRLQKECGQAEDELIKRLDDYEIPIPRERFLEIIKEVYHA